MHITTLFSLLLKIMYCGTHKYTHTHTPLTLDFIFLMKCSNIDCFTYTKP